MTNERGKAFLQELWELCQKYNAQISGCGCCESPWLDIDMGTPAEVHCEYLKVSAKGWSMRPDELPRWALETNHGFIPPHRFKNNKPIIKRREERESD